MIGWREVTSSATKTNDWTGKCPAPIGWFFLITTLQITNAQMAASWPQSSLSGVAGSTTHIPCVVARTHIGDSPNLFLWYKDGSKMPFYTLDLREGEEKQEFIDQELEGRVRSDFGGSHLVLDPTLGSDSGKYRCRVDFNNSPTLSAYVILTVYVVPKRIVIFGADKKQVRGGILRGLREGDPLKLYCIVTGGHPLPEVTWWKGNRRLSNRSIIAGEEGQILTSEENEEAFLSMGMEIGIKHVRAVLSIPALSRDYARANITCKATNNNITEPLFTTLFLEVYTQPHSVAIRGDGSPLVEGRRAGLECEAKGSHPTAIMSWTKTVFEIVTELNSTQSLPLHQEDVSISTVKFVPEASDHGAKVTCHARNPNLSTKGAFSSTTLQVTFAPRVTLRLGYSLANESITEGDDVYFECQIMSNPQPFSIKWYKDGKEVLQDRRQGILVSSNNLVLQMIKRTSAGNYSCSAENKLALTTSNPIQLLIKYPPICESSPKTVAVIEGEDVRLTCKVDANPIDKLRFIWYFNNTLDTVAVEGHRVQVRHGYSYLDYTPRSSRDYGILACWARNSIGTQADPCQFFVVEAGIPESVTDCEFVNQTSNSLEIHCNPGDDGGLTQWFVGRVFSYETRKLLATYKEKVPRFLVLGLTAGNDYSFTVTSHNRKGKSQPVELIAVKLKVAEKRMSDVSTLPVYSLLGIILGVVGGALFFLALWVTFAFYKLRRCRCLSEDEGETQSSALNAERSSPGNSKGVASPPTPASEVRTPTIISAAPLQPFGIREEARPDVVKSANAPQEVPPSASQDDSSPWYYYSNQSCSEQRMTSFSRAADTLGSSSPT